MAKPDKTAFLSVWPKCFLIFLGIVELCCVIVLILTELCNVASNFWVTNVFAGGWCGVVLMVHFLAVFASTCCCPGPSAAFRAMIITIVALVACGTLISFDAVFIAQPNTCILTPSCQSNANSQTMFSYYFQQSFLTAFTSLGPFRNYTQTQTKFLCQTVQIGVGSLSFVLCLIFLIIYYVTRSKAAKRVSPGLLQAGPQAPQSSQPNNRPNYQSNYQPQGGYSQQPRAPQLPPGEIPWNGNRRY